MLTFTNAVLDPAAHEYILVVWGQSTGRPTGSQLDGFTAFPNTALVTAAGIDSTFSAISARTVGAARTITVPGPLSVNQWKGAEVYFFITGTFGTAQTGRAVVTSNTATVLTVDIANDVAAGANSLWLLMPNERWKFYPNVRVLVPFIPETPGSYPAGVPLVPGRSFPASITGYDKAGLFQNFTFLEGVNGPGFQIAASAAGLTTFTTPATDPTDTWVGAWARIANSVGRVTAQTAAGAWTVDGWVGPNGSVAAPAPGTATIYKPHWKDNPAHAIPGYGFRQPTNDMQPGATTGSDGRVHNRPLGVTTYSYGVSGAESTLYGFVLPYAYAMSSFLGVRINVVYLAVDSTSMFQGNARSGGFQGEIGWWNDDTGIDWTPAKSDNLGARLRTMVTTMAQGALVAEGNTKTAKVLGIAGFQGESEAFNVFGQEAYGRMLPTFYKWFRDFIDDAGMSPYPAPAKVPVVHALITESWGFADPDRVVNAAITDFAVRDGFAATINTDDSPMLVDQIHFSGIGEVANAKHAADAMTRLIDLAFSMGALR